MTPPDVIVYPLGEYALTAVLGERIDRELHGRVLTLAQQARRLPHVLEVVPAYAAVTVFYDPLRVGYAGISAQVREIAARAAATAPFSAGKYWEVPTVYDGPDLEVVARATGLDATEVVALHSGTTYTVFMLGFAPGFAYLGPLDRALELPRRAVPRTRMNPGAVAIAGRQTAIYPLPTPGGWHVLGHTSLTLFDVRRERAALFAPGDTVRFVSAKS
jgi:KipI family sensor histidine kinase inhibitor